MSDISSATTMDRIYRHQRRIYDVTRKYYLLGRDQLLDELNPRSGHTILEMGCGTGRNLVAAARRYPFTDIYGFDVSPAMLETAGVALRRAGLSGRIRLAQADATRFEPQAVFGQPGFDRIFISYTLSMVPDWEAALAQAVMALRPEGQLHIVDFGQQQGLPGWFRRVLFAWLAGFSVHPDPRLERTLRDLAARHGLSFRLSHPWRGYAIRAVLTRVVRAAPASMVRQSAVA